MFPDRRYNLKRQQGFLIPLALFILVGMLALSLTAARLTGQSSTSSTLEMLSTQAFFAAESGGQYAMYKLFSGVTSQAGTDSNCATLAETVNFPNTALGLSACAVNISCTATASGGTGFYTLTSAASCGSGDLSAQRSIQISASMP